MSLRDDITNSYNNILNEAIAPRPGATQRPQARPKTTQRPQPRPTGSSNQNMPTGAYSGIKRQPTKKTFENPMGGIQRAATNVFNSAKFYDNPQSNNSQQKTQARPSSQQARPAQPVRPSSQPQRGAGAEGDSDLLGTGSRQTRPAQQPRPSQPVRPSSQPQRGAGAEGDSDLLGTGSRQTRPTQQPRPVQTTQPVRPAQPQPTQIQPTGNPFDPMGIISYGNQMLANRQQPTPSVMRATNPTDARQLQQNAMNPSGANTPVPVGLNGQRAINAGQPTPSVMRATNQVDARQLQRNAMNPSGAYTPVPVGLDGRTPADRPNQFTQPSLWQRIKNFFGGNYGYTSGYGNNPSADAYTMQLQRQNALSAGSGQPSVGQPAPRMIGAGAEGQIDLLQPATPARGVPSGQGGPGLNDAPVAPIAPAPRAIPSPRGAGAEGDLGLLGVRTSPRGVPSGQGGAGLNDTPVSTNSPKSNAQPTSSGKDDDMVPILDRNGKIVGYRSKTKAGAEKAVKKLSEPFSGPDTKSGAAGEL